jgi:uncharacterized membrane protein YphA (DoxX/SURF4 family)
MMRAYALTALRIVTGFLFLQHGYPKLFGSLPGSGEAEGPAEFLSIIWSPASSRWSEEH